MAAGLRRRSSGRSIASLVVGARCRRRREPTVATHPLVAPHLAAPPLVVESDVHALLARPKEPLPHLAMTPERRWFWPLRCSEVAALCIVKRCLGTTEECANEVAWAKMATEGSVMVAKWWLQVV